MKKELIALNRKTEICATLKQMLKRKSIQKITIQELADQCSISRYTFYYHFTDIYDCLSWLLQEEIRNCSQIWGQGLTWNEIAPSLIRNIRENRFIYRHLLGSPRPELHNIFRQEVRPLVQLYVSRAMELHHMEAREEYMAFLSDFFTSVLGGLLAILVQEDPGYSDQVLIQYLDTVMDEGFESIIYRAKQRGFCRETGGGGGGRSASHSDAWNYLL